MKLLPILAGLLLAVSAAAQTCPPPSIAPQISSASTLSVTEGSSGSLSITTTGSPKPTVAVVGTLPAGVTFAASTGVLGGVPVVGTAGVYPLTITAVNGVVPDASKQLTLTVLPLPVQGGLWIPALNTSWQWQIGALPSASKLLKVQMYDVDGEDATPALVAALHAQNTKAVCYFSAGTSENWRDDYKQFTTQVKGKGNGWKGENWLDIRNIAVLAPIMTARMQVCKDKGFDAIEPDNIDGWTNSTGFPLTKQDQLTYNEWLANTAHSLGLSAALKNDGDQVKDLVSFFDFDINEQCVEYGECNNLLPFIQAGKAVFEAEYKNSKNTCSILNGLNFNGAIFTEDLDGKRTACR